MPGNARIAISAVLLVVAIVGIVVQAGVLQRDAFLGIPTSQTRIVIAGYTIVAIYALFSIVARLRGAARKP